MSGLLDGAYDFAIGNLIHVSVPRTIQVDHGKAPIDLLVENIADGATHDAFVRSNAPRCYPRTRVRVRAEIESWMHSTGAATRQKILWVTGPAGTGKSSIAGSLTDAWEMDKTLAATFFFSTLKKVSHCQSKSRFVATLAYQLIQHPRLSALRDQVLAAIRNDPMVFKKRLKDQVEILLLGPLRNTSFPPFQQLPTTILVDGLEECEVDEPGQESKEELHEEVLSSLLHATNDSSFPFRIIVASRPEFVIREFFARNRATTTQIFLDERYDPDADISRFAKGKFGEIRRRFSLPPSWPPKEDEVVSTLASNASGQFIYVATVMRYIEDGGEHPGVRLDHILHWEVELSCSTLNPFERLDALYSRILQTSPEPLLAAMWLHAILELHTESSDTVAIVRAFLETRTGEMNWLLGNLSSLLSITHTFRFFHKSFLDFLGSERRSRALYIDPINTTLFLEHRWYQVLKHRGPQIGLDAFSLDHFLRHYSDSWTVRYFHPAPSLSPRQYDPEDVRWWSDVACAEPAQQRIEKLKRMQGIVHERCGRFRCHSHCKTWRNVGAHN